MRPLEIPEDHELAPYYKAHRLNLALTQLEKKFNVTLDYPETKEIAKQAVHFRYLIYRKYDRVKLDEAYGRPDELNRDAHRAEALELFTKLTGIKPDGWPWRPISGKNAAALGITLLKKPALRAERARLIKANLVSKHLKETQQVAIANAMAMFEGQYPDITLTFPSGDVIPLIEFIHLSHAPPTIRRARVRRLAQPAK